ncbi:MAG: serine hydrolase [Caldilineaceae bacterium]
MYKRTQPPLNFSTAKVLRICSIILSDVSGGSALDFAEETLFQPLSIEPQFWEADPQGHNWGGYGLRMTTRDLAKLGYLYLNAGQWGDAQIVSADWIAQSTRKQRDGGPPLGVGYGYLWWVPTVGEHDAYAAFGRGGQLLLVIPGLDTVVVITAAPDVVAPNLLQLLERVVVPALRVQS